MPPLPTVTAVVLSMGNRPVELQQALETLLAQQGVDLDVVVVGNGWDPVGLPAGVRATHLPSNVGIPEGRNVGARTATGEFVFFYDDATLPTDDVLVRLARVLVAQPTVAVAQPRGADPDGLPTPRRWIPRMRPDGGGRGGRAAVFWEGVCMIRRTALEQVGWWPGHFWYGHEGIDLAFRLLDAGWEIEYRPEVVVHHPATVPTRHAVYYRLNARNRVWVARRNLPAPLVPVYVGVWVAITLVRVRRPEALREWWSGLLAGVREGCGPRRPMSWRTVAKLTLVGRPPVL